AIGVKSQVEAALGTAIGTGSFVKDSAQFGLAFGAGAMVDKQNAVSIGAGSKTDQEARYVDRAVIKSIDPITGAESTVETLYNDFAGGGPHLKPGDQVSFGSAGYERQLKNVAPGEISPTSTDAINGSQLAAITATAQGRMDKLEDGDIDTYFHFNDPAMTQKAGNATTNLGGIKDKAGATGQYAVTAGVDAQATQTRGVAMGHNAKATGLQGTALGSNTIAKKTEDLAVGSYTKASGGQSIAIGNDVQATGDRTIVIGSRSQELGRQPNQTGFDMSANTASSGNMAIAIGAGLTRGGHQDKVAQVLGDYSIALGTSSKTEEDGDEGIAIGRNSLVTKEKGIAIGSGAKAEGIQSISIGTGNTVSGNNSGAFGDPSTVSGDASYSFGNNNTIAQDNTFVLGNDVSTTQANSVVLGNLSTDREATTVTDATVNGVAYGTFAGKGSPAHGVVSVGGVDTERQIINVAPGEISDTSTDAINGSQLHAVVKNSGWILKKNQDNTTAGNEEDKVTSGDIVNFADGVGTKVVMTKTETADQPDVNTIKIDIDPNTLPGTLIKGGTNIADVKKETDPDGTTHFTVDAEGTNVKGEGLIEVNTPTKDGDNDFNYVVKLNDEAEDNLNQLKTNVLSFEPNSGAKITTKLGDTLGIKAGNGTGDYSTDNLKTYNEGNEIIIKMKEKPTFKEVTADKVTINNAPTAGTDAVNKDYLDGKLGNPIQLGANTSQTAEKSINDGLVKFNILGEDGITTEGDAGDNIVVKLDDATKQKLADIDNKANKDVTIKLQSDSNATDTKNHENDITFGVKGDNKYIKTSASGSDIKVELDKDELSKDFANKDLSNISNDGKEAITALNNIVVDGDTTKVTANTLNNGRKEFKVEVKKGAIDEDKLSQTVKDAIAEKSREKVTVGDGLTVNPNPALADTDNQTFHIELAQDTKNALSEGKKHTKVIAGDNVTVSGNGKEDTPYEISVDTIDNLNNNSSAPVSSTAVKNALDDQANRLNQNITDAVDALGNKPILLGSDSTDTDEQTLNKDPVKFKIKSGDAGNGFVGDNLQTKADGDTILIGMTDKPNFTEVNADTMTVDTTDPNNNKSVVNVEALKNSAWNLEVNGNQADKVKQNDTVNFKSSDSSITITEAGGDEKTNIDFTIAKTTLNKNADGTVSAANGDGDKLVNATNLADAINSAKHTVIGKNSELNGTNSDKTQIGAGDELTINAGKNLNLNMNGNEIVVSTTDTPEFKSAKVDNTDPNDTKSVVNVDYLNANKSRETVTEGTGIKVTPSGDKDNQDFVVALDKDTQKAIANGQKHTIVTDGENTKASLVSTDPTTGQTTYKVDVVTSNTVDPNGTAPVNGQAVDKAITDAVTPIKADVADNKTAIAGNTTEINELKENTILLGAVNDSTKTDAQKLSKKPIKFNIKGENGLEATAAGDTVTVKIDKATKDKIDNAANQDLSNISDDGKKNITKLGTIVEAEDNSIDVSAPEVDPTTGQKTYKVKVATTNLTTDSDAGTVNTPTGADATKIATAGDVANAINNSFWKTQAKDGVDGGVVTKDDEQKVKAGDKVTFDAGKNMKLVQSGKGYTYATKDEVEFNKVTATKGDIGGVEIADGNVDGVNVSALAANTIKLTGNDGETSTQSLNKAGGIAFDIQGEDEISTKAVADTNDVKIKLDLTKLSDANKEAITALNNVVVDDGKTTKVTEKDLNDGRKEFKVEVRDGGIDATKLAQTVKDDIAEGKKHTTVSQGDGVIVSPP
ncbi:MAG: hypothetical protein KGV45_00185, partial [Gammaproteobacteria bacterium]|nr:hypothetical protein [Gammaproteobacteria bacterium]